MNDRDKGAVQHQDANSKRADKGAVEKNVVAVGGTILLLISSYYRTSA